MINIQSLKKDFMKKSALNVISSTIRPFFYQSLSYKKIVFFFFSRRANLAAVYQTIFASAKLGLNADKNNKTLAKDSQAPSSDSTQQQKKKKINRNLSFCVLLQETVSWCYW